jgi:Spy/CpxP family protein refolding chaperone
MMPAYWLFARLKLTEDQKARVKQTLESHRASVDSSQQRLQQEEAALNYLLEAEPIDRDVVLSQIDRVIHARAEMERTNAVMTLEMREYLTYSQWMRVQAEAHKR